MNDLKDDMVMNKDRSGLLSCTLLSRTKIQFIVFGMGCQALPLSPRLDSTCSVWGVKRRAYCVDASSPGTNSPFSLMDTVRVDLHLAASHQVFKNKTGTTFTLLIAIYFQRK